MDGVTLENRWLEALWETSPEKIREEEAMLAEPKCYTRKCAHFLGVKQPDGTEETECVYCVAFPDGIPDDIAYGRNLHTKPVAGDHGFQFLQGPEAGVMPGGEV